MNNVDEKWNEDLTKNRGLILIDEHLEIGEKDLLNQYLKEDTAGIIFIEVTHEELRKRIKGDITKKRSEITDEDIDGQQSIARNRSFFLAKRLNIPFVVIRNKKLGLSRKVCLLDYFFKVFVV
jgi:adenylate kinase